MNVVAYLRVSGAAQLDGTGFERQQAACALYAEAHDLHLSDIYREEAVSGTKDIEHRPRFQQMVAALINSGTKTILIESLDRLARELMVQQSMLVYLASKELTLINVNTGENVTDAILGDPMRRAMVQMQGIFAELDKSMIVAKLRKGRERTKAKHGRCEGQKPYGFYAQEGPILEEIRALRTSGMYHHDIAKNLNARSIPARAGGAWNAAVIGRILQRQSSDTRLRTTCAKAQGNLTLALC